MESDREATGCQCRRRNGCGFRAGSISSDIFTLLHGHGSRGLDRPEIPAGPVRRETYIA